MNKRAESDSRTLVIALILAAIVLIVLVVSVSAFYGTKVFPFAKYFGFGNDNETTAYVKIIGLDEKTQSMQYYSGVDWYPISEESKKLGDVIIKPAEIKADINSFWFIAQKVNVPRKSLPYTLENIPKLNPPKYGSTFVIQELNAGSNGKDNYILIAYTYYTTSPDGSRSGKLAPSFFKITGDNKLLVRDPDKKEIVAVGSLDQISAPPQLNSYQIKTSIVSPADLSQDSLNALKAIDGKKFPENPPVPGDNTAEGRGSGNYKLTTNPEYTFKTILTAEYDELKDLIKESYAKNIYLRLYKDNIPLDVYLHASLDDKGIVKYTLEAVKHSTSPFEEVPLDKIDLAQKEVMKDAIGWRDSITINPVFLHVYDDKGNQIAIDKSYFCAQAMGGRITIDLSQNKAQNTQCPQS